MLAGLGRDTSEGALRSHACVTDTSSLYMDLRQRPRGEEEGIRHEQGLQRREGLLGDKLILLTGLHRDVLSVTHDVWPICTESDLVRERGEWQGVLVEREESLKILVDDHVCPIWWD